jgi:muramidase (phage lysozyme)
MSALLDTIGRCEGNYNLMWCGKKFSDFSKHPNIKNTCTTNGKAITSTAAGRYGFLYGTYESLKKKGEFAKDFSLEEQDKAAIKLITQKGITQEQLKTALESKNKDQLIPIFDKIAPVWSSVPSSAKEGKSYYGQHAQSTEKITAYILSCYETLKTNSK